MVLCNEVTRWMKDDITQPPMEGVYVYGLYLEGAGWDRRSCKLIDSKPKVLFEAMPVIRMYAENNGEDSVWETEDSIFLQVTMTSSTSCLRACVCSSRYTFGPAISL